MKNNEQRRKNYARRKVLFEQLRLQSEILCDSYKDERRSSVVLGRMMLIILEIVGQRKMNDARRQALADHFVDCSVTDSEKVVELGGGQDRNTIHLSGSFDINDLARRITWSEERGGQIIENNA